MDCNLESFPEPMAYWIRNNNKQDIIISNAKYDTLHLKGSTNAYKSEMRLRIKDLKPTDFGTYTCIARNALGETRGTIKLYEIPKPSTQTSEFMSFTSTSKEHSSGQKKFYVGTARSSSSFDDNQSGEYIQSRV